MLSIKSRYLWKAKVDGAGVVNSVKAKATKISSNVKDGTKIAKDDKRPDIIIRKSKTSSLIKS